jgi:hypothetical protein
LGLRWGSGTAAPAPLPALGSAPALGAVTAAIWTVARAVALLGRAQLDRADGRRVDRCDRHPHRSDRDRSEDEADREEGHGARRGRAKLAPPGGGIDEIVLMFVVMRAGHAPRERWADLVKGL